MVLVVHDRHALILIIPLVVVVIVVIRVDPRIFIVLLRHVPVNGNERRERHPDRTRRRRLRRRCRRGRGGGEGKESFQGLRPFSLALDLGFPPDVGDVRTGAARDDTLHTMGGIPGGVGSESVEVYVGVGVGADAYGCGDTGNATACMECGGGGGIERPHTDRVVLPEGEG
jgi:hypothetical protein